MIKCGEKMEDGRLNFSLPEEYRLYTLLLGMPSTADLKDSVLEDKEDLTKAGVGVDVYLASTLAYMPEGALESLREDIIREASGHVDTEHNAKVFIQDAVKVSEDVWYITASVKLKSDSEKRFVTEYLIVRGAIEDKVNTR